MKHESPLILLPFSGLYSAVTRTRLAAYRRGWLNVAQLAAPVVSVGNLTTGGTGKTPLVDWVCRVVAKDFKRVCVLTRGYGRVNPQSQVVVSDGNVLLSDEVASGDEAFLLAQSLMGIAAVVSNPNREAAGKWAIENLGTEVFVLDDGFQHLRLARNLDLVTIDSTNPFSNGRLLPYGRLREPVTSLSRAGAILLTRTDQVEDWQQIKTEAERLAPGVPVFSSRMTTVSVRGLQGEPQPLDELRRQPVGAFCGVGNPESFFNHLRSGGLTMGFTRAFIDHHRYRESDVQELVEQAKTNGCQALVTTAKDAPKLSALKLDLPCYVLDIKIVIDDEQELINLIEKACQKRL
jgi:tetraacyldisaccharide 4'-kinase